MKKVFFLFCTISILIVSCDLYKKDAEPKVNVIKVMSGSSAMIRVKSYFNEASSFEISEQPQNGLVSFSPGTDSEYLQYESHSESLVDDSFSVSAKNSSGQVTETQNFLMREASSCGLGIQTDSLILHIGETVIIDLLATDFFCGVDFKDAAISEGCSEGTAGSVVYSIDKVNSKVLLTFTATEIPNGPNSTTYTCYNLGVNPDFNLASASFDWRDHPEKFERFYSSYVTFFVIE